MKLEVAGSLAKFTLTPQDEMTHFFVVTCYAASSPSLALDAVVRGQRAAPGDAPGSFSFAETLSHTTSPLHQPAALTACYAGTNATDFTQVWGGWDDAFKAKLLDEELAESSLGCQYSFGNEVRDALTVVPGTVRVPSPVSFSFMSEAEIDDAVNGKKSAAAHRPYSFESDALIGPKPDFGERDK